MATFIGQELGSYRIISQVGKGGMATVYKAFQPSLDRYVAIKIMPPFYAQQDDTFLKRFRREARAVGKLRHPNILIVIDYGEHDDVTYIVMEYVDAGTLTDRLGSPMPLLEIAEILEQVASALDYAHGQGVIHRDVKPSNILLPKPNWPLLTDFGLAKIVGGSQLTLTGSIAGTPAYMSPEQGQGEHVDARSDIYSLGIVLYEMATGVVPFYAETPMAVVVKHIIDPLPLPTSKNPNLPEDVERVILKALAKNTKDRYQRVSDLASAFSAAIGKANLAVRASETIDQESIATERAPSSIELPRTFGERAIDVETEIGPKVAYDGQAVVDPVEKESTPSNAGPSRTLPKWLLPAALVGGLLCIVGFAGIAAVGLLSSAIAPTEVVIPTLTALQHVTAARDFLDEGDYVGVIREYEAAIELGSNDAEVYLDLADAYIIVGRGEDAVQPIAAAIEAAPNVAWVFQSAGLYYRDLGLHDEAIASFERALALEPAATWLYDAMADSYIALGEQEKADEILGTTVEVVEEKDASYYESLGWSYYDAGNYSAAEFAFNEAIIIDPTYFPAWDGLSDMHWGLGNYDLALTTLDEALAANPNEAWFYEKKGWIHKEIGNIEEAEKAFGAAINLDPVWSTGYSALAKLFTDDGDYDRAIAVLESGLAANANRDDIYDTLGYAYSEQGDYPNAIAAFKNAIELYPEYGYYYRNLASVYRYADRFDEAIETLEIAGSYSQFDAWLKESIGWEYANLGRCDLALGYFQEALQMDPSIVTAEEGLVFCEG